MNTTKNVKQDYRNVFMQLRADIKASPGGFEQVASNLNVKVDTLRGQTNPDLDVNPPTLANFLEIINTVNATRTVAALASLVDKGLIDLDYSGENDNQVEVFLKVAGRASKLLSTGFEAAEDSRFDAVEREQLLPLLLELMQVSGRLYKALNR